MFSNKELTLKDFILDPCKATPGFEFFLRKNKKIDISKLTNKLKSKKYFIEKDSQPFFVSFNIDKSKITVFKSLKIIIRNIDDKENAENLLNKILPLLNEVLQG
jgi:ArsR family metal-binding transcriptional regulator